MSSVAADSLGRTWFTALAETTDGEAPRPGSLLTGSCRLGDEDAALVAVVPDPDSPWPRARHGEVGLAEGLGLASWVRRVPAGTPIVMVVDVPGQAYGYVEELFGLHQVLAASVQAIAERRLAGEAVVAVIVGSAISGAFLATGLQAGRIVALDHEEVQVQVMSKQSTARITRRSMAELDRAAQHVPAVAYDGASFQRLGAVTQLVTPQDPHRPTQHDVQSVLAAVQAAVDDIRACADPSLSGRLAGPQARQQRALSIAVREAVDAEW